MHYVQRRILPQLFAALIVVGFLVPPVGAQGDDSPSEPECPEGLVYDAVGDICVLPENLPPPAEEPPVDELPAEESVGELPAEEQPVDDLPDDEQPVDDTGEEAPAVAPDEVSLFDALTAAANERGVTKNLTLLTFACPVNWDPGTRPIESSREMCTEPIVDAMNYSILFEGTEVTTAALRSEVDMSNNLTENGVPLPAGMWTIRENLQEGLEDPFAFCAIYAADGSTRLTVTEIIPGGSLDILLAAGEEVNCEWYSVATVPDVAAEPSLGLEVKVFSCPAPSEFSGGLDDCTLPLPGPLTFEAIYDGQVVATGTLTSPENAVEVDQDAPSGEWTIRPLLPQGWIDPHLTCTIVTSTGEHLGEITHAPPADGTLGVTVKVNPDQRAQCQIWLFAGDAGESVVVVTRDCPENYDAATLSPGVRKATCPGLQFQAVSVSVDGANPVQGESTRNGVAVFPSQPGTWRIQVDTGLGVVGRAVTFVTCDQTFAALGQVQTIEPTINSDRRSVSIDLDDGDALRCDFFFGPATDMVAEADVTETESAMPASESDSTVTDSEAAAPEAPNPAMGTDSEATSPASSGESFGGGSVPTESATGSDEAAMADDVASQATSSLAIQHWDCPDLLAPASTADDLIATCTASLEPSSWVVNGTPVDTGDGYAVWADLPLETVVVTNGAAIGKEDAASAVFCSLALTDVDEPLIGVEVAVSDSAIELVFDQPSVVYCNWFVAP